MTESMDKMRSEFEAWFFDDYTAESKERISNAEYRNAIVQNSWLVWQAATAQAASVPLTTDQLFANDDLMALNADHGMQMSDIAKIVRVIEAAHGIEAAPPVGIKGGEQ